MWSSWNTINAYGLTWAVQASTSALPNVQGHGRFPTMFVVSQTVSIGCWLLNIQSMYRVAYLAMGQFTSQVTVRQQELESEDKSSIGRPTGKKGMSLILIHPKIARICQIYPLSTNALPQRYFFIDQISLVLRASWHMASNRLKSMTAGEAEKQRLWSWIHGLPCITMKPSKNHWFLVSQQLTDS